MRGRCQVTSLHATLRAALAPSLNEYADGMCRVSGAREPGDAPRILAEDAAAAVAAWLGEDAQVLAAARVIERMLYEGDPETGCEWADMRPVARAALGALTHHEAGE